LFKDIILQRFDDCDPQVKKVIAEVLIIEQGNISKLRPRVAEEIDKVIEQIANPASTQSRPQRPVDQTEVSF
jgi:hypothetical protein